MNKFNLTALFFVFFLFFGSGRVQCFNDEEKNSFLVKRTVSPKCELKPSVKYAILKIEREVKDLRKDQEEDLRKILAEITKVQNKVEDIYSLLKPAKKSKNCAELYQQGIKKSGVYQIDPDGRGSFNVRCDMTTSGGGWTVFQRRLDGSVDFYRGWQDYKHGFGDLSGEFWLGLNKIHRLTSHEQNEFRIDLEDTSGNTRYAEYDFFAVTSEKQKYQLSLGTFSGTAGDSFTYHKGMSFSTKDSDNDKDGGNCAVSFKGAWWYHRCHASNLNGQYLHGAHTSYADGVNWSAWKGYKYSLKSTSMKIRPRVFGLKK